MTEDNKNIPVDNDMDNVDNNEDRTPVDGDGASDVNEVDASAYNAATNAGANANNETPTQKDNNPSSAMPEDFADDNMGDRLERLGGEPAPVITPEEFARLQKAGQVHIDSRGRVRTASRSGPNAGVSLRKRRAWYVS